MDINSSFMTTLTNFAVQLAIAVVVLVVGWILVGWALRLIKKILDARKVDETVSKFLCSLLGILFKAIVIITAATMVGIKTTSFIAILGAAGLAIGLALQGSLANFAGGVLLILFKPFKVGEFVEVGGHAGTVNSIQIFNTILKTPDNRTIFVPNGVVAGGSIVNFSAEKTRRVDLVYGIGYGDDIKAAKKTIADIVAKDKRVLASPEPQIVVSNLGESSVDITTRIWCKSGDYWGVFFDMQETVKTTFDKKGISIPFPQRDVHLFENK